MLKIAVLWLFKHWVVMLPVICVTAFMVLPHKPVLPMFTGMAALGFVWSTYHAWLHFTSKFIK